MLFSTSDL